MFYKAKIGLTESPDRPGLNRPGPDRSGPNRTGIRLWQQVAGRFGNQRWLVAMIAWASLVIPATAAEVDARLSSGQAYVGDSITLQIAIQNAGQYQPPEIPTVDGLQIESAGAAQRSSQTTIINGRVSKRESVVLQYDVTPQRAGTFEVPSLEVSVDGRLVKTSPLGFVASVSETGDLMFVEIEGKQEKVYVGEPLELVLKIGIRPYRDPELKYTLSEGDTWRTRSRGSSWGPFRKQIQEMADRRRRPGGEPVFRKSEDGEKKRYFVYEIETTFYPNKPGKIDAGDVRIVFDYPVELRERRRRSMMDQFLGGGFESAFAPQLEIAKTRPISASASVDATRVVPLPTEGRPDFFKGAVGNYAIQAKTDSAAVNAGDPITLQIAVSGDGPLDSLQPPSLDSLNENFRFDDQPLAGFIQDGVKYFTTTIRPKTEAVQEIPAIAMSFFDPKKERYETVSSKAIPIEVSPAEKLLMDSIVGDSNSTKDEPNSAHSIATAVPSWSPTNWLMNNSTEAVVLEDQPPASLAGLAIWLYSIPAVLFSITMLSRARASMSTLFNWVRSAKQRAERQLDEAASPAEIPPILSQYVSSAFPSRTERVGSDWQTCLGALRSNGQSNLAADLEALAYRCKTDGSDQGVTATRVEEAKQWLEKTEAARTLSNGRFRGPRRDKRSTLAKPITGLILIAFLSLTATPKIQAASGVVLLTTDQQETLLREASKAYLDASRLNAKQASPVFETAAMKYQQLADSGIRNGILYRNLANAYLRSGRVGHAIANYRKAESLDPTSLRNQLGLLVGQARGGVQLTQWHMPLLWLLVGAVFSVAGWFCLGRGLLRQRKPAVASGLVALLVSAGCLTMMLRQTVYAPTGQAVAIVADLDVRQGDGKDFPVVQKLDNTEGHVVKIEQQRGDWYRIAAADSVAGWVTADSLEVISARKSNK